MALKEFTFKNGAILSRVDCGPAANLEITTLPGNVSKFDTDIYHSDKF